MMSYKILILCTLVAFVSAGRLPRVANGNDTRPGQYPYHVSLYHGLLLPIHPIAFCGGAIINEQWVLTAAYCIYEAMESGGIVIKAGNVNYKDASETEQLSNVAATFVHEKYNDNLGPNDVALLKLETPLKFNKFVAPIGLPETDSVPVGTGIITGLGSTTHMMDLRLPKVLQAVSLPIISNDECAKIVDVPEEINLVDDYRFCTGPTDSNQGYCLHDTGSPLVVKENGKNVLTGVATFGFAADCTTPGYPSIYSRVSAYNDWIKETIAKN